MTKKKAGAAQSVENLPSASRQEDGKMIPASKRSVSVPIIRPLADANEPLAYQKVDLPTTDEIARRWGAHQQSIKEQMEKKVAQEKKNRPAPPADSSGPINRDTMIMDLVSNYHEVLPILMDVGLHCIGCQLSAYDTIQTGCELHGFDQETIDTLIRTMNTVIKQTIKDGEKTNAASSKKKSKTKNSPVPIK